MGTLQAHVQYEVRGYEATVISIPLINLGDQQRNGSTRRKIHASEPTRVGPHRRLGVRARSWTYTRTLITYDDCGIHATIYKSIWMCHVDDEPPHLNLSGLCQLGQKRCHRSPQGLIFTVT